MLLKPHEILSYLGFDVPEEGVEINPHDAYLVTKSLMLAGQTMSIEAIPESSIEDMHVMLATMIAKKTGREQAPLKEDTVQRLRKTIEVILNLHFKK